jgi:hypothetical protein
MSVALAGLLLAAGLALAAPREPVRAALGQKALPQACRPPALVGGVMVLPPGHPVIGTVPVPAPALQLAPGLPPGHPPIAGRALRPGQAARPLAPPLPLFTGPDTVDL